MDNSNLKIGKSLSFEGKSTKTDPFKTIGLVDDIDSFFIGAKPAKTELDLDRLYKENEEAQKLNAKTNDLEGQPKTEEPEETSRMGKIMQVASIAYFRDLFNVSTQDVVERLKYSVFPFKKTTLFEGKQYDLYGPLWIVFTVVFTTSIFGTIFSYSGEMEREKLTNMSIHQIGKSFTLTLCYLVLNPLVLFYQFTKEGARSTKYFEIVAIYGYSFSIIPLMEIILILPFGLFKYLFLFVAVFISAFMIRKELIELNKKYLPRREVWNIRTYGIASHVVWLLVFKLLFL